MAYMPFNNTLDFPLKLKRAMDVRGGLTSAALARKMKIKWRTKTDRATIGRWLAGESIPKNPQVIEALEDVLGVKGIISLPADQFFEQNNLYLFYAGMEFFPIIDNNKEASGIFEKKLGECLDGVKTSMHYTRLCEFDRKEDYRVEFEIPELQHGRFVNRLLGNEIAWEKVEIFYSIPQLLCAIQSLVALDGTKYTLRFYWAPPDSYPVINIESFDHKRFMIGGFDPERVYENNCVLLGDREPMRSFLEKYWETVWNFGRPERLTFSNADKIAAKLPGYNESDWKERKVLIMEKTKKLRFL